MPPIPPFLISFQDSLTLNSDRHIVLKQHFINMSMASGRYVRGVWAKSKQESSGILYVMISEKQ